MHSKCDILVLTASFGSGHISVSEAIQSYVHEVDPSLKIKSVDFYEVVNPIFYKSMYKGYELLIKNGHRLYNMYYYRKNESDALQRMDVASKTNMNRLVKYIEEVKPRMVISTFPICTGYMAKYKKMYDRQLPLATCITDVVDNNEWLYDENDVYFVATKEIKMKLVNKGILESSIVVTGIPIREKFIKNYSKVSLRYKNGYDKTEQIILMMGGGLGLLPNEEAFYIKLHYALPEAKLIVITGNNKNLYQKILKMKKPYIKVVGYTDKVDEYMKIADLLVSKAGGITLFEAIAIGLPLIIYKPTLGQEVENCSFIEKKGVGYITDDEGALHQEIVNIMHSEDRKKVLDDRIKELRKEIDMKALSSKIIELYYEQSTYEHYVGVI